MANADSKLPRRWTVIASGILLAALALVVLYTGRSAFHSPIAVVVVAAIGLAATLLQIRFRPQSGRPVHTPVWLNSAGLLCALAAVFADYLHLHPAVALSAALLAVVCFAISSFLLLDRVRKG